MHETIGHIIVATFACFNVNCVYCKLSSFNEHCSYIFDPFCRILIFAVHCQALVCSLENRCS